MCIGSSPSIPDPAPLPAAPQAMQQPESAQRQVRDDAMDKARRAAGLEGTVSTSTAGLTDSANVYKKTLLGQ